MSSVKFLWAILLVFIVGLQSRLWIGEGSYVQLWQLQQKNHAQAEVNDQLVARNAALNAEVLDLKNGYAAIEEHARADLGMIKNGESFYLIVDSAR